MPNGYLPPVVATLGGSSADFIAKLREAKALLEQWGRSEEKATLGLETGGAIAKFKALSAALSRDGITVPLKLHYDATSWARQAAQMSIGDAILASMIPTRDLRAGGGGGVLGVAAGAAAGSSGRRGGALGAMLATLLWGGGAAGLSRRWGLLGGFGAGMAGFGSLASFAGLGPEHLLMTGVGLGGSAVGAGLGAGLLGLGAAGVTGAGMLADAGGIGQAMGDTRNVLQAQNALSQAIAVYGKNSAQAKDAQAQLNYTLAGFSPVARSAVQATADTAQGFKSMYDKVTGTAEKLGAQILTQAMQVGEKFLPTLGAAATKNMGIIQSSLQPLFSWMGSASGGLGIFKNLEQIFSSRLPTAMQAFDQGVELLLRTINLVAPQTGGMIAALAKMTTHFNGSGWSKWAAGVDHLIGIFREWEGLIKIVVQDIYQLFHADAGTASGIVESLTQMLTKLHAWETSAAGQSQMHSVFETHKQEILELLQLLPSLVKGFGSVYLTVAPALTQALTAVLRVIVPVLAAFTRNPFGAWVVGLAIISGKLGLLSGLFRSVVPFLGRTIAGFLGIGGAGNVMAEGEVAASLGARALQVALGVGVLGAILLLGLGIYELVKHWKTVWADIKKVTEVVWKFIDNDIFQPMGRFFTQTIPRWVSDAGGFFSRMWQDVTGWFARMWHDASADATNLWHDVAGFFKNLWTDVTTGISTWWGNTETWLKNLPGNIIKAIGDVTHLLFDIGKKIIQSLLDGMKNVWKDVTGFVGGIGGWIKSHKGPPEADAVLLVENGQLIMRGFGVGLRQGFATHVAPFVSGVSSQINAQVRASAGAYGSGGVSADPTQRTLTLMLTELQAQTRTAAEQLKVNKGQLDQMATFAPTVARAVRGGQSQLLQGLRGGSVR